jgi:septum formation protein
MRSIILASQSPRRKDLLTKMGVDFTVQPSNFEEHLDHSRSTEEVALELATGKARDVARLHPAAIIISSDTIVTIDGKQLGKPKDETDARKTLTMLASRAHTVTTAVVVICQEEQKELSEVVTSEVLFKPLNKGALETYLASGDWHDKAGSYGVQSGAAPLIDRITGDYNAVLGLPTKDLAKLLQIFDVPAKPVTLETTVPVL